MLSLVLVSLLAASKPAATVVPDEDAAAFEQSQQFARSLLSSPSPRDRAFGALLGVEDGSDGSSANARALREAAQAAPDDVLVQALWAMRSSKADSCDASSPCPDRRFAQARVEPDNGLAWIQGLNDLDPVEDAKEYDALLGKVVAAGHLDDHYADFVAAWTEISERTRPRGEALVAGVAYSAAMTWQWFGITRACKAERYPQLPASHFELCADFGRKLMQSDSALITRTIAFAVIKASGLATAQDLEAKRVMDWKQHALVRSAASPAEDRRFIEDVLSTRSEERALELMLARQGVPQLPPADWTVEAAFAQKVQ
jgi:hypothetical protein